MDLQTSGGKPVTSDNANPPDNFRAYSPQIADYIRRQPDSPASNSLSRVAPRRRARRLTPGPSWVKRASPQLAAHLEVAVSALTLSSTRVPALTTGYVVGSAVDARSAPAGQLEHLGCARHGRVAGRGHRQGAVRGAVLDGTVRDLVQRVHDPGRAGLLDIRQRDRITWAESSPCVFHELRPGLGLSELAGLGDAATTASLSASSGSRALST